MGQTALHYAVWTESPETAFLLLEHDANPNIPYDKGWTALMYAAASGNSRLVKALLEHHADPNAKSSDHLSVLQHTGPQPEIIRLLKQAGASR